MHGLKEIKLAHLYRSPTLTDENVGYIPKILSREYKAYHLMEYLARLRIYEKL